MEQIMIAVKPGKPGDIKSISIIDKRHVKVLYRDNRMVTYLYNPHLDEVIKTRKIPTIEGL